MSLKDAVLAAADGLEADARAFHAGDKELAEVRATLLGHAQALRAAALAAGDPAPAAGLPQPSHQDFIAQARREFRGKVRRVDDGGEDRMREVVGGPCDGTMSALPAAAPPGARCSLGGAVYELRADGRLHFAG